METPRIPLQASAILLWDAQWGSHFAGDPLCRHLPSHPDMLSSWHGFSPNHPLILVLFPSPAYRWGHESLVRFRVCREGKRADPVCGIPEGTRGPARSDAGAPSCSAPAGLPRAAVSPCDPGSGPIQCAVSSSPSISLHTHLPCLPIKAPFVTTLQVKLISLERNMENSVHFECICKPQAPLGPVGSSCSVWIHCPGGMVFLLSASAYYLQLISPKFTLAMSWQEAKKVNSKLSSLLTPGRIL